MNSSHQPKQSSRSPRLHLMYFVDASETRSVSVSTTVLKFSIIVLIGMALFSLTCNAVLFFAVRHLLFVQNEIRQLKAAHIAQSIVHENLLREGPFVVANGGSDLLNLTTKKIAEALVRKTPVRFEDPVAGLERGQRDDQASRPGQTDQESPASASSPEGDSGQQTDPQEGSQGASDTGPSPIEITGVKHEHKAAENKLVVTFTLKNIAQFGTRISGHLCAIVTAVDTNGKRVHLPYPSDFDDQPDGPLHCESGLKVHFARYKPTQMVLDSPPLAWQSLNVYFSDDNGTTEHSFVLSK